MTAQAQQSCLGSYGRRAGSGETAGGWSRYPGTPQVAPYINEWTMNARTCASVNAKNWNHCDMYLHLCGSLVTKSSGFSVIWIPECLARKIEAAFGRVSGVLNPHPSSGEYSQQPPALSCVNVLKFPLPRCLGSDWMSGECFTTTKTSTTGLLEHSSGRQVMVQEVKAEFECFLHPGIVSQLQ